MPPAARVCVAYTSDTYLCRPVRGWTDLPSVNDGEVRRISEGLGSLRKSDGPGVHARGGQ
jgi:hypothetical protein